MESLDLSFHWNDGFSVRLSRVFRRPGGGGLPGLCYNSFLMTNLRLQLSHYHFLSKRRMANFLTAYSPLLICALFLLVGAAVVDDYGVGTDTPFHRETAIYTVDYVLGKSDDLLSDWLSFYGVAFEAPLLLAERALGLEDIRSIHLARHLLIHLLFVLAALCCYRLTWNLFHSRGLAILAMLLFLLHPRIYAHSFFNAKDLPFLSMFIIALYLLERAFRRDTVRAFLLSGVVVGLLTNIRIVGLMLLPAMLAMRGGDLVYAPGWAGRRRVLLTAGCFALTAVLVLYATWPWLWGDPMGRFLESWERMSGFPIVVSILFQGESIPATTPPPDYIPAWFALTTPPFILLLGLVGMAAVVVRGIARPGAVFRDTKLRFAFLLLAGFSLPVLAAILLDSTLYNGWRQLYFLYAPFCLLAVFGWRWLVTTLPNLRWRAGIYGLTGVGIICTILQMVQIHPHQQVYFNFLVNRANPDYLRTQYDLDYWRIGGSQALRYLLERHPGERIYLIAPHSWTLSAEILPAADRQRLVLNSREHDPDYQLSGAHRAGDINAVYARQVYNSPLLSVRALDTTLMDAAAVDYYRQEYRAAVGGEPVIQAEYDVYMNGEALTFVKENCPPGHLSGQFSAKVYQFLPQQQTGQLLNAGSFRHLKSRGVRMGNKCLAVIPLPEYPIAHILAGQYYPAASDQPATPIWEELYDLATPGLRSRIAALRESNRKPDAAADFDLYLLDKSLVYYRESCDPVAIREQFFLHFLPVNPADLPPLSSRGFENRDFTFMERGGYFDGFCLAVLPLPDYPVAAIRTGQFIAGEGQLWAVELTVAQ